MSRLAIIELHKEELKFSAGHFMLIADHERESMHGHDYQIQVAFYTQIQQNGMAFDCRLYKQRLLDICQTLDYRFILPAQSDYFHLEKTSDRYIATFGEETFSFYHRDVAILPICNVTIEELSRWFLDQLTKDLNELAEHHIQGILLKVFNGRGESGASFWGNCSL